MKKKKKSEISKTQRHGIGNLGELLQQHGESAFAIPNVRSFVWRHSQRLQHSAQRSDTLIDWLKFTRNHASSSQHRTNCGNQVDADNSHSLDFWLCWFTHTKCAHAEERKFVKTPERKKQKKTKAKKG